VLISAELEGNVREGSHIVNSSQVFADFWDIAHSSNIFQKKRCFESKQNNSKICRHIQLEENPGAWPIQFDFQLLA
jgi:hypothetical protein